MRAYRRTRAQQAIAPDGRGARTVIVKLKKSDMTTLTRSATLPYATAEPATLIAHRPPTAAGSGREQADFAFPALAFQVCPMFARSRCFRNWNKNHEGRTGRHPGSGCARPNPKRVAGASVTMSPPPQFGHGWLQGAGHGVMNLPGRDARHRTGAGTDAAGRQSRHRQASQPRRQLGLAGLHQRVDLTAMLTSVNAVR